MSVKLPIELKIVDWKNIASPEAVVIYTESFEKAKTLVKTAVELMGLVVDPKTPAVAKNLETSAIEIYIHEDA